MERISIDYMAPAEISFPASMRRVGIVNNMSETPNNRSIAMNKFTPKSNTEVSRQLKYYNGNSRIAAEALAKAIANENYFEEVIICDSMLRSQDIYHRENTLSRNEVNELIHLLNVDFIIALENLEIYLLHKVEAIPEWGIYAGITDAKISPTVRIYMPNRSIPMVTITPNDSIYWEVFNSQATPLINRFDSVRTILNEASEYGGSIPVKHILPHWETTTRYFVSGRNVAMRDAAIFVREQNWDEAIRLWEQVYNLKKGKQKIYAAFNLALGYEMKDELDIAEQWAMKAQQTAAELNKSKTVEAGSQSIEEVPGYYTVTLYLKELQKRKKNLTQLKNQTERLHNDF